MQCEIDDVLATTETSRNDHSSETTTFLHAGMHRLPELTLMEVQWVTDVGIEARLCKLSSKLCFRFRHAQTGGAHAMPASVLQETHRVKKHDTLVR